MYSIKKLILKISQNSLGDTCDGGVFIEEPDQNNYLVRKVVCQKFVNLLKSTSSGYFPGNLVNVLRTKIFQCNFYLAASVIFLLYFLHFIAFLDIYKHQPIIFSKTFQKLLL